MNENQREIAEDNKENSETSCMQTYGQIILHWPGDVKWKNMRVSR